MKLDNFSSCCIKMTEAKFPEGIGIVENTDSKLTSL